MWPLTSTTMWRCCVGLAGQERSAEYVEFVESDSEAFGEIGA
jgi:hypothetical protein